MLASMTGYGVAEGKMLDAQVRVEIRSLNSRYFDFSTRIPGFLIPLETEIKSVVHQTVKRGKVSVFINVNGKNSFPSSFSVDQEKVSFFIKELRKMGKKEGVDGDLQLSDFLRFPDIFVSKQQNYNLPSLKRVLLPVVRKAVQNLAAMKKKEGENILKDICMRVKKIETVTGQIAKKAQKEPRRLKTRLDERLKKNNVNLSLNPERLEQEVAYLLDKTDITEEITRLKSHCDIFNATLRGKGEAGKRLEFISQEMNREANTIGSKTQNVTIAQGVIAIKLEIEKIREQIQNIE